MDTTLITGQIYTKLSYEPTPNQKKVIESIASWLADNQTDRIFLLNGYAGTGKTTIISAFVQAMESMGRRVVLLAPTGRAAKVLSSYSNRPAYTIHKHIYREQTNASYEHHYSLNFNKSQDTIYVVDEASMISTYKPSDSSSFGSGSLLSDLVEFVFSGTRCRLMLVGDTAQLPPIGDDFSPALSKDEMENYSQVILEEMDEVVRQQQMSGILFNATLLRVMIEKQIAAIPKFETSYPDVFSITGAELIEELESCYSKYGKDSVIVITRSNKRANTYNEGIRRSIFSAEDEIEGGDMLMVVKNNYFYPEHLQDSPVNFIANGDIVKLRKIRRHETLYGARYATATINLVDYDNYEMECKVLLDTLRSLSPSLTKDESEKIFREVEQDYLDIKNKKERLKKIRENEYFNALQIKFAYAVTCHKAQGGQWSAVFIDRCIFGEEEMSLDLLRWLYTAVTRATERLYFVNFPDEFFSEKQK